ncbi:Trm112 family protein [Candidatus Odyssella thessalonicensis]|uniref:Trm112 family protein n=1 Tax=Candidatus Odyssella thessalonicensis TaxID=84647 RepID=UPI000225AF0A|nr:Trm112 family protein [Candidatus Odyssella thessalonicensis]
MRIQPIIEDKTVGIAVDPKLLEILVCPLTKTTLTYDRQNNRLISEAAGLAYPIVKGVPIMLIDEAEIVDEAKAQEFKDMFNKDCQ